MIEEGKEMTLSEQMRQISENAWNSKAKEVIMQTIMQQIEDYADRGEYDAMVSFGDDYHQRYAEQIKTTLKNEGFEVKDMTAYKDNGREMLIGFFVYWYEPKGEEAKIIHAKSKLKEKVIADRLYRDIIDFVKSEAVEGKRETTYEFKDRYITKAIEGAIANKLNSEGFTAPAFLSCARYSNETIKISW